MKKRAMSLKEAYDSMDKDCEDHVCYACFTRWEDSKRCDTFLCPSCAPLGVKVGDGDIGKGVYCKIPKIICDTTTRFLHCDPSQEYEVDEWSDSGKERFLLIGGINSEGTPTLIPILHTDTSINFYQKLKL